MKRCPTPIALLIGSLFVVLLASSLASAQSAKARVTLRDVSLWRNHAVRLSDDGVWYAVRYRPSTSDTIEEETSASEAGPEAPADGDTAADGDSPETGKATVPSPKWSEAERRDIDLYGEDAMTEVLYIRKADGAKEHRVTRGTSPAFSHDSKWIAYSVAPKKKSQSTRGKPEKNEASKSERVVIELLNLGTEEVRRWEIEGESSSVSVRFPKKTQDFVIHSKSGLLLFDLERSAETYIGNVGEYQFSKDSQLLYYTIKTDDRHGNGVYRRDMERGTTRTLVSGPDIFSALALNEGEDALALFRSDPVGEEKKAPKKRLVMISQLADEQPDVVSQSPEEWTGMPEGMVLTPRLDWSQDGTRLFLALKKDKNSSGDDAKEASGSDKQGEEPSESNDAAAAPPETAIVAKAAVDVWHWKDEALQSEQMLRGNRERTFDAVLDTANKTLVQLSDDDLRLRGRTEDDRWAIGADQTPYVSDWDVTRADYYRVDLITGERKLLIKRFVGRVDMFPAGDQALYWRDGHYWVYHFADDTHRNVTNGTSVSFVNAEHDYYGSSPAYGVEGFTSGGGSIILRHRHDLWLQPVDGTPGTCLTQGVGEEKKIRFRLGLPPERRRDDVELEERYVDVSSPLILSGFGSQSKKSGYFLLTGDTIETLLYEPRQIRSLHKAKNADVVTFSEGDFQNCPETYLGDSRFEHSTRLTRTNPHQDDFKWGRRILVDYTNKDGVPLQGILTIPEGYRQGSRLPMIVYSYEKLSDGLHRYSTPRIAGAGTSEAFYVSDDYLYLQPDIHFRLRTSHSDMHECIDEAIQRVVELGYADENRIGYLGHSFGGHAAMFISTQKNRFAAIAGGAGVSNLVQGFNIDIVSDGSNEQDYYITGQGRLTASPADDLGLYLDQSPIFHAKKMDTPLLLYHGTADTVVKWEHSFGFYNILRFLKKPVILLSYRGEGHGLRDFESRKDLQLRLKQFFDHHLKGAPAAAWITDGVSFADRPDAKKKEKPGRTVPPWK